MISDWLQSAGIGLLARAVYFFPVYGESPLQSIPLTAESFKLSFVYLQKCDSH